MPISKRDRDIVRELARRTLDIANHPTNVQRRRDWLDHNDLKGAPVRVLAEYEGVREDIFPHRHLQCEDEWARAIEGALRHVIYRFDVLQDDHVVEPVFDLKWDVHCSDYGVEIVNHRGQTGDGSMGSRRWDAPIGDLDADFDKLRPRTFSVDRESTIEKKAALEDLLGDILTVRIHGNHYWSLGMTNRAIDLIGLEQLMLAMYDNPDGLHRIMGFLRDDYLAFTDWLEREGLYTLNNGNDYTGSGTQGYTGDLPAEDFDPDGPVRRRDLWCLLESQETVGVGPEQFREFIFPYQKDIGDRFGLVYYGCCEPVHTRRHVIEELENLRSISVSPWADEAVMAEFCKGRYVYSRKPNPTLISTERFDEEAIRADIRNTLETARGNAIEIIMKDVHTLRGQPERLPRWVEIVREEQG